MKELQEEIQALQKEIAIDKKNEEIEAIEEEQEEINKLYEQLLSDKEIYGEADRLLTAGNVDEMLKLLENYAVDYSDVGMLLGKSFTDSFKEEIQNAMDALDLLLNKKNNFETPSETPSTPTTTTPSTPPPATTVQSIGKGSRVKVTDPYETIYVDSYTSRGSGTWKGAGVSSGDTLYVVNDNNGRVALSRTNNINGALGWIDKKKVSAFATGGMTASSGFAMLHDKERVLSAEQTKAFNDLVYEVLPQLKNIPTVFLKNIASSMPSMNKPTENTTGIINNEWNITNNTPVDVETMGKDINKIFKQELRRFGSLKGR